MRLIAKAAPRSIESELIPFVHALAERHREETPEQLVRLLVVLGFFAATPVAVWYAMAAELSLRAHFGLSAMALVLLGSLGLLLEPDPRATATPEIGSVESKLPYWCWQFTFSDPFALLLFPASLFRALRHLFGSVPGLTGNERRAAAQLLALLAHGQSYQELRARGCFGTKRELFASAAMKLVRFGLLEEKSRQARRGTYLSDAGRAMVRRAAPEPEEARFGRAEILVNSLP
ncbi:MAG: hypothetical protein HYV63_16685 [Candidatus Schekmanbacteria bacterium]|nr:hypothetical protein [Candidatus Schekmanbacteria bacterium]